MPFLSPLDLDFIAREIRSFKSSPRRANMLTASRYADGFHDILTKQRSALDPDGNPIPLPNLPNSRIVDNQFLKMIVQKVNYLLGRPFSFQCDDPNLAALLARTFQSDFRRLINQIGEDTLISGVGYLFLGYDQGKLVPQRIPPWELIPEWADPEHSKLDCAIRVYSLPDYDSRARAVSYRDFAEVFTHEGVFFFDLKNGRLTPRHPFHQNYISARRGSLTADFNWNDIPIVMFRANSRETPLICRVKSLQDSLNAIESNFRNVMEEDVRDSVLVLVNYDGEDLSSFRNNLAQYGVIPVRTVDGGAGDVKSLRVEVNAQNYRAVLDVFKRAIIENAAGFDANDDRLRGSPNELNLRSMYSDIDLDANRMEAEFQAAFERLLRFYMIHFGNARLGAFDPASVNVIFDRDVMISESEVIDNCLKSRDILSHDTIVAMHPWVADPAKEMARLRE